MRVCFEGLCFASSQPAAGDDEPDAVRSAGRSTLDTLTLTENGGGGGRPAPPPVIRRSPPKAPKAAMADQQYEDALQAKEERIRDLEARLEAKEQEIADLRSHLDKFQSVFPFHAKNALRTPRARKQRAQGISAEPQSEATLQELASQTFPVFDKNEK